MLTVLLKFCREKKYLSLYTLNDPLKFIYGRILAVNEDYIVILSVSQQGCFDGLIIKETKEIVKIEIDGLYCNKMNCLITNDYCDYAEIDSSNENILDMVLLLAKEKQWIVSAEISNSGYDDAVGFVEVVDDVCQFHQIDEYGMDDGTLFVPIELISSLSCNSEEENRILRLWIKNQN